MPIRGSLREVSLPDVLQLLALGQKSGCLAVTDRSNFGYIYFDRGSISYASIVNRRDRLGDLLVKNGLVEPEMLASAVDAQGSRTAKRLGEILIERGAITPEQLERYIRVQIEEAVYFLFTWTQGTFSFEPDQMPEEGAMLVSIHPENLLLEGARRVDEWSLIEKKIPSLDLIFALAPSLADLPAEELTEEQRKVIPLLDGRRSVREVVEESGLVEFDVGKALFGLVQAGFAHPQGRKAPPTPAEAGAKRIQEHRNLAIAFYKTGMLREAMAELERLLELAPDDLSAHFYTALIELRAERPMSAIRRLRELVERGGRWGAAFHNLALALEQLGRMDDALLALDRAQALLGDHPQLLLSRGVLLCKAGRVDAAIHAFAAYRDRVGDGDRPPAAYFAFAILAHAAGGQLEEARRQAEEGVQLYPHVAPVLLHAGAVRERASDWEEAELLYRRAAEEAPALPQARKSLGDALYRRAAYPDAAEQYEQAIALAPDDGDDAYFKLGNIRYKQGAREEAVRLWRRALELNPDNGIARTNLELVERSLADATG
jgi:tetratricopeptide (TPR) repeat protein